MSKKTLFNLPPEDSSLEEEEEDCDVEPPRPVSTSNKYSQIELINTKSIIETTLLKSAGILSDFTTSAISESASIFDGILSPDKFAFQFTPPPTKPRPQSRSRSWSASSKPTYNRVTGKRKPNLSNLPKGILEIFRSDSNSSITPQNAAKKHRYHSGKMALKQRNPDGIKEKTLLQGTASTDSVIPKIVVVSSPLTLKPKKKKLKDTMPSEDDNNSSKHSKKHPHPSKFYHHLLENNAEKGPISSMVVRKSAKLNIGLEKGIPFVLGPKSKMPYFNTFAEKDLNRWGEESESTPGLKWVINVGNLGDEEISLTTSGKCRLTITGFRQPSMNYPEGQTVSQVVTFPPTVDINNLVFYRSNDARDFLVIQERS